jgi:proteasome accessory factor B
MTISKTQRWLDLIAFLVKHRFPVPVDEIMASVPAYRRRWLEGSERERQAVRRMFERDKDELRALGMPLETVRYTIEYGLEEAEGYRLSSRDFYLPYLRVLGGRSSGGGEAAGAGAGGPGPRGPYGAREVELRQEDAALAVEALERVAGLPSFPLARESRSALWKVAFDVNVEELGGAPVLYVGRPGAEALRERVSALMVAVQCRKKVRFRYHGIYRGEATEREVSPYGLLFQHGSWYLIGHDALRDDVRVFRVGRMEQPEVNRQALKTPDYRVPEAFNLERYGRLDPWELGAGEEAALGARVRFDFPASLWAERNRYGRLVQELAGGAAVRAFDVHQVDPFLRWLQTFTGEAIVLSPPELRAEQVELARRTAAAHGGGGPAGGEGGP